MGDSIAVSCFGRELTQKSVGRVTLEFVAIHTHRH